MAIANATNRLRKSKVKVRLWFYYLMAAIILDKLILKVKEIASKYDVKIYTIGAGTNQDFTRIPGKGLQRMKSMKKRCNL